MQNQIMILVRYQTKPGMRDAYLKAINDGKMAEGSRSEAGNLRYDYFFPEEGEDTLCLIEIWKDQEALKAHQSMPHYLALGELKKDYVLETSITRYEITAM